MPLMYEPDQWAFFTTGPSLTEQEHKDSCDINKMVRNAARGIPVRGSGSEPQYGYDDMSLDAVQYRIQKQQLEDELLKTSKTQEFTEEELKYISPKVQQKFKLRQKQKQNPNQNTPPPETPPAPPKTPQETPVS